MTADADALDIAGCCTVTVRRAALAEILALRHAELRPGLPLHTARFDGDDDTTTRHFGAFVSTGELTGAKSGSENAVGCASFMAEPRDGEAAYQLRGMATRADLVRRGIGAALLRHALPRLAAETHLFWCNARIAAVPFYRRMGWEIASGVFDVPSVGPHHVMTYRVPDRGS